MTNFKIGNVIERFVWTAVQAFIGSLPATIALSSDDLVAVGYAGLTAAIAAVVSLAKNLTSEGIVTESARRSGRGPSAPLH